MRKYGMAGADSTAGAKKAATPAAEAPATTEEALAG